MFNNNLFSLLLVPSQFLQNCFLSTQQETNVDEYASTCICTSINRKDL